MNVLYIPIDALTLDPANARSHGERSIKEIKTSLRRFGQQKPVVVDQDNVVRAGNGTVTAAMQLGWTQVAAVRSDLTERDLRAYAIADNRSAELSKFDPMRLAGCLSDDSLGDVGFTESEIQKALAAADAAAGGGQKSEKPKPLKLTADQWAVVRQAIDRLRESDPEVTDGRAIELIAADFLAGTGA